MKLEDDKKLPARQKFWCWLISSLHGPSSQAGQYHYVTKQVPIYDIAGVFRLLSAIMDKITIATLDEEITAVTHLEFDPSRQELMEYVEDLRRAMFRLDDTNKRLTPKNRVSFPDMYVRTRIVRAARKIPVYKTLIDTILASKLEEWTALTSEQLLIRLESVRVNENVLTSQRRLPVTTEVDVVAANMAQKPKEKRTCNEYAKSGQCSKPGCQFLHMPRQQQQQQKQQQQHQQQQQQQQKPKQKASQQQVQQSSSQAQQAQEKKTKCTRCGGDHHQSTCTYSGQCGWCGKQNHKEDVCISKAKGFAKAMSVKAPDGVSLSANVVMLYEPQDTEYVEPVCMSTKIGETVKERFYADTGANCPIHTNMRSAASFYRTTMDINTASGRKSMTSDGVGKMLLYTPDGVPMPGFNKVVFVGKATEKLASVGDICDNGLVCVFKKDRLIICEDVDVKGKVLIEEPRCSRTRLYPLTLHRKVGERVDVTVTLVDAPTPTSLNAPMPTPEHTPEHTTQEVLPDEIVEVDGALPAALLARTYRKPGLSEIDRFHAKFGDCGIKYLKRCLPNLTVPKQYRCEYCIDAKIHKFAHNAAPPNTRVEYASGVCIHTDHSGPYAKSISGARYSQLFLDRGSGYLWAYRQKKKGGVLQRSTSSPT